MTPFAHVVCGPDPAHDRAFCSECFDVVERYRGADTWAACFTRDELAQMPTRRFDACSGCDCWLVLPTRRGVR